MATVQKKQSFIQRIKRSLNAKSTPAYKTYNAKEIETVLMRARLYLQKRASELNAGLENKLWQLKKQKPPEQEPDSQLISLTLHVSWLVIDINAIKILMVIIKNLESRAYNLEQSNGNVHKLQAEEAAWLQNIAYYRKIKGYSSLDQFSEFTLNYFKGVDITGDNAIESKVYPEIRALKYSIDEVPVGTVEQEMRFLYNKIFREEVVNKILLKAKESSARCNKIRKSQQTHQNHHHHHQGVIIGNHSHSSPRAQSRSRSHSHSHEKHFGNKPRDQNKTSIAGKESTQKSVVNTKIKHQESDMIRRMANLGYRHAEITQDERISLDIIRKNFSGKPPILTSLLFPKFE